MLRWLPVLCKIRVGKGSARRTCSGCGWGRLQARRVAPSAKFDKTSNAHTQAPNICSLLFAIPDVLVITPGACRQHYLPGSGSCAGVGSKKLNNLLQPRCGCCPRLTCSYLIIYTYGRLGLGTNFCNEFVYMYPMYCTPVYQDRISHCWCQKYEYSSFLGMMRARAKRNAKVTITCIPEKRSRKSYPSPSPSTNFQNANHEKESTPALPLCCFVANSPLSQR